MLICLKKLRDSVVLSGISVSGPAIQRSGHQGFFALHDLLHYATQTTLGFNEAFFGLMASGWSFDNFTRRDDPNYRPLPPQAIIAEHPVAALTRHHRDAAIRDHALLAVLTDDINQDLASSMSACGIPVPALAPAQVAAIYDRFDELGGRWAAIPVGEHLALRFPA